MKRFRMKAPMILGAVGLVGLMTAGCADDYHRYPDRPYTYADHVRWCFRHHQAYNPNNNVYIGSDGSPHICVEH